MVELITKGWMAMARRARQDLDFWSNHIARQQASGRSVREYCQLENLQAHHFYYWRKRAAAAISTGHQFASAQLARQATATSQHATTASTTTNLGEQDQLVVIRLGQHATVHVPAAMLETIEAVLKMTLRIGASGSEPSVPGFRSIIVRS